MPGYLNEFMFRFNRRRFRRRGMIFYWVLNLDVAHPPVRYKVLIAREPCYLAVTRPRVPAEPGMPPANCPKRGDPGTLVERIPPKEPL